MPTAASSARNGTMRAMRIRRIAPVEAGPGPLASSTLPIPEPGPRELLVEVFTCGVCRTELDEIEGRTPPPSLPVTPGHQVIGRVVRQGCDCRRAWRGRRVGIAWIHSACGACEWCRRGLENLCPDFRACGRDVHGGYAEYMTVSEGFAHPVPDAIGDAEAAPLLCAGAVGLRALRLCDLSDGEPLGLTGFGASAHLVLKMARALYPRSDLFVFARNPQERAFARELGAGWAGDSCDPPPRPLGAIIDTTPAWKPVLAAMERLAPGGRLVINAIRKESADKGALQTLDYARHLWHEKLLRTVANVTRKDVRDCLELATTIPLVPEVTEYPLSEANRALREMKSGRIRGAKVLRIRSS